MGGTIGCGGHWAAQTTGRPRKASCGQVRWITTCRVSEPAHTQRNAHIGCVCAGSGCRMSVGISTLLCACAGVYGHFFWDVCCSGFMMLVIVIFHIKWWPAVSSLLLPFFRIPLPQLLPRRSNNKKQVRNVWTSETSQGTPEPNPARDQRRHGSSVGVCVQWIWYASIPNNTQACAFQAPPPGVLRRAMGRA